MFSSSNCWETCRSGVSLLDTCKPGRPCVAILNLVVLFNWNPPEADPPDKNDCFPRSRLPETVQSNSETPVSPRRRLPPEQHGLWGRISRLEIWHGHGYYLHLLSELGYWLLCILLSLLSLFPCLLTFITTVHEKTWNYWNKSDERKFWTSAKEGNQHWNLMRHRRVTLEWGGCWVVDGGPLIPSQKIFKGKKLKLNRCLEIQSSPFSPPNVLPLTDWDLEKISTSNIIQICKYTNSGIYLK